MVRCASVPYLSPVESAGIPALNVSLFAVYMSAAASAFFAFNVSFKPRLNRCMEDRPFGIDFAALPAL
jgi:hypothetical protein